jgi:hypothetical protein
LGHADLPLLEEFEHFVVGTDVLDFDQLQLLDDTVETVLDCGVADAKSLLHVLDGAMAAYELADEHLVFVSQAGQQRRLEVTVDGDVAASQSHGGDRERTVSYQIGQFVPLGHRGLPSSN